MSNIPDRSTDAEYLSCIRCGLRLAVRPTYRENLVEAASPRGRVALARSGLDAQLAQTPNLFKQMDACFDCLACNEIWPVGIRPSELAIEMRRVQAQLHAAPWKNAFFGALIGKPRRLDLGGTLSGEHGVGALKRPFIEKALGSVSVEIQRRIKTALDPVDTLNPGKILRYCQPFYAIKPAKEQ